MADIQVGIIESEFIQNKNDAQHLGHKQTDRQTDGQTNSDQKSRVTKNKEKKGHHFLAVNISLPKLSVVICSHRTLFHRITETLAAWKPPCL